MSSHKLYFTDRTKTPITVENGTLDLSLSIVEQGLQVAPYGFYINQAFLHLLTNFANSSPPSSPIQGQMWYDNFTNQLKVWNSTEWTTVGRVVFSSTAPVDTHELWFDENESQLKVWNGASYQSVASRYLELAGGTVTGNVTGTTLTVDGSTFFTSIAPSASITTIEIFNEYGFAQDVPIQNVAGTNSVTFDLSGASFTIDGADPLAVTAQSYVFGVRSEQYPQLSKIVATLDDTFVTYRDVDMLNNPILGVPDINEPSSLVPKNLLAAVTIMKSSYVFTAGDTMTGELSSRVDHGIDSTNVQMSTLSLSNPAQNRNMVFDGSVANTLTISNKGNATNVPLLGIDANDNSVNVHSRVIDNVTAPVDDSDMGNKLFTDDLFTAVYNDIQTNIAARQAKAWIKFDKTTDTIINSFNVDSLTKVQNGEWTVTFTNGIGSNRMPVPTDESVVISGNGVSTLVKIQTVATCDVDEFTATVYRTTDQIYIYSASDGGDDGSMDAYALDKVTRIRTTAGAQTVCVAFFGR